MRIGGRFLIDGGVASPNPVWAARRLGAQTVVSVSLRPEAPPGPRPWRSRVMPPIPEDGPADLELIIDTREYFAWSPRDVSKLINLGRRTTEQALADIERLVAGDEARGATADAAA